MQIFSFRRNFRSLSLSVVIIAIVAMATGCKSPSNNAEVVTTNTDSMTSQKDTTIITQMDTTKETPKPVAKDTTAKAPVIKKKPLTIVFDNLSSPTAQVILSLYTPENKFPDKKDRLREMKFTPAGNTLTCTIPDLEYGEYAVASFQDLQGKGEIHTNMIGIPLDPIAFSNNFHPKVKAPKFDDCKFKYNEENNVVSMSMYKMVGK